MSGNFPIFQLENENRKQVILPKGLRGVNPAWDSHFSNVKIGKYQRIILSQLFSITCLGNKQTECFFKFLPFLYWAVWKTPWAVWKTGVFHTASRFPHSSGCFPHCSVLSCSVENEMSSSFPSNRSTEKTVKIKKRTASHAAYKPAHMEAQLMLRRMILTQEHDIWRLLFPLAFPRNCRVWLEAYGT